MLEVTLAVVVLVGAISPALSSPGDETTTLTECSLKSLTDCLTELDISGKPLGKEVIPYLSNTELADLCRHWEESEPCIRRVREACEIVNSTVASDKHEIAQRVRQINLGHEYICESDMRITYSSKIRGCVEDEEAALMEIEKTCLGKYHNMSWYYDTKNPDNIYNFCKAAKAYLACLAEGVAEICGDAISAWVKAYHRRLWLPHMNNIKCDPDDGMEYGAVVIITICGGATVYCVICVIAAFVKDSDKFKEYISKCKMCQKRKAADDGKGEYAMQTQETTKDL